MGAPHFQAWRRTATYAAIAALLAAVLAAISDELFPLAVGLLTLLPVGSHVRHVGWRNALAEPSAITVIVAFYVAVFPLRALVIAANHYTDVAYQRLPITSTSLVSLLALASVATTVLIESYYLVRRWRPNRLEPARAPLPRHEAVVRLAVLLSGLSLLSLIAIIVQHGGVAGAHAAFVTHTVTAVLQGNTGGIASSGWELFAVPTVWSCAYVIFSVGSRRSTRIIFAAASIIVLAADLYIYGSRLNSTLALIGVWIIYYYSGHRVPAKAIILAVLLGVIISQPIIASRGTLAPQHLSTVEEYSRILGYGVLDVSLAIRSEPQEIRAQLEQPSRWTDLPEYFVPSFLWSGRPNIATVSLGLYVAQDIGTANDQATGFPSTYILEGWLIGGWPGAIILSMLFGLTLGIVSRRLVGDQSSPGPASVLTYCFITTTAWNYFKDGDIVFSFVGQTRTAIYLLFLLWVTGVIGRIAHAPAQANHRASIIRDGLPAKHAVAPANGARPVYDSD